MELRGSVTELQDLDRTVSQLCEGIKHPIGSIFRIPYQYLVNWGVDVTEENKDQIEKWSLESYYHEWKNSIAASYAAIKAATTAAGFKRGNPELNNALGRFSATIIGSMAEEDPKRDFRIVDIGAGEGETTVAVIDYMYLHGMAHLIDRCQFILIEPSTDALMNSKNESGAVYRLREHAVNDTHEVNFVIIGNTNHKFMEIMGTEDYDMVISSAVFHHMSFPTYLGTLYDKLAKDGVVVVGDWYNSIWKHPAFVAEVLERLGMGPDKLLEFKRIFDIRVGDLKRLKDQLPEDERRTNDLMVPFVDMIGNEFLINDVPTKSRLFFLEGHEIFGDRLEKFNDHGFETDSGELQEKHAGFLKMLSNVNVLEPDNRSARVLAAAKIPGKRKPKKPELKPKLLC